MATLQTIPTEIHLRIVEFLRPCDAAVLALSCRILRRCLGYGNQFYWYNWIRKGIPPSEDPQLSTDYETSDDSGLLNPERYINNLRQDCKEFQPENKDYWAEALRIISGKSEHGCSACLATPKNGETSQHCYFAYFPISKPGVVESGERLKRRYCYPCFKEWYIEIDDFKFAYPEIPLPPQVGIRMICDFAGHYDPEAQYGLPVRAIPITIATKTIENFFGVKFEIASSIPRRFRTRWSRARGEYEAQLVDEALNFIKDIYQRKYKHLQVVMTPEVYYKRFSDSLLHHILLDSFYTGIHDIVPTQRPNADTIPPLSIADKVIKISKLLNREPKDQIRAEKLADHIHFRLFGDPDNFNPYNLEHPYYMLIRTEMLRSCFGTRVQPVGVFTWHLLYTNLYMNPKPDFHSDYIRCYWCFRQNNWSDTKDIRYIPHDSGIRFTERWIAAHILMHHPDLIWKRPKNRVHDHCTVLLGVHDVFMLNRDFSTHIDSDAVEMFRKEYPGFEKEELEDIPPGLLRYSGHRISTSNYFHWV